MNFIEEKVFKWHNYAIETTGDLSPTLRPENKESMHHMGGAAGESVYLYFEALKQFYANNDRAAQPPANLSVLSFGFGMGYNEILTALFFLKNKKDISLLQLNSYEKDVFLYDLFNQWLTKNNSAQSIYDEVWGGIVKATLNEGESVDLNDIKGCLLYLLENKKWKQLGPVTVIADFSDHQFDVIFYDAYSSKTNDYLWTENFLSEFIRSKVKLEFVFSTYACTGVLKRVASANGCDFIKRDGFQGKRNSSMMSRFKGRRPRET